MRQHLSLREHFRRGNAHPQEPCRRVVIGIHLPASVADDQKGAVLLQKRGRALIIMYTAIDESDNLAWVEQFERQRLE